MDELLGKVVGRLREHLEHEKKVIHLAPLETFENRGDLERQKIGEQLLFDRKIGVLLLAGGQGSRLGSDLPKALIPVTRFRCKTLLHLMCEKVVAAGKKYGRQIPLAIMVSPLNSRAIEEHLVEGNYFGLQKEQIEIFEQGMLPSLNKNGEAIFDKNGDVVCAPNGNGEVLSLFMQTGLAKLFESRGVSSVTTLSIDNALADPFDLDLLGLQAQKNNDVTLVGVIRSADDKKMGLLGEVDGRLAVADYFECSEADLLSDKYPLGNSGIYLFSMEFIKACAAEVTALPLHVAEKSGLYKFESFIFDNFRSGKRFGVVAFPREEIFAPLKNRTGPDSFDSVQAALQVRDRLQFKRVTGASADNKKFELAADFYYPTEETLQKWKGKNLAEGSGYVRA